MHRAAGPLPRTRTSHSSFVDGVRSAAAGAAARAVRLLEDTSDVEEGGDRVSCDGDVATEDTACLLVAVGDATRCTRPTKASADARDATISAAAFMVRWGRVQLQRCSDEWEVEPGDRRRAIEVELAGSFEVGPWSATYVLNSFVDPN